ncbi:hypothetical protein D9611_002008 [Ephemerocybe angulata]|uniref:Oxidase ustYa n=1 Tax=Ephemerocybe angulata TaxID=980116 RepID=A0A8H5FMS8_9AGAR|nr:hypothetical protein D9611_002008 [Tulosesus angulatus]
MMGRDISPLHAGMLVGIAILTTLNVARFLLNVGYLDRIGKAAQLPAVQGNGVPRDIPIPIQQAMMVFEPTERYGLHDVQDWESLTPGSGWIKLTSGNTSWPFAVTMYHQLHCLNFMRYDLTQSKKGVKPTKDVLGHAGHCYNYVRMGIVCGSDITLEHRVVEELACDNPAPPAPGVPHICRDWTQIREFVGENYHRNIDYLIRSTG